MTKTNKILIGLLVLQVVLIMGMRMSSEPVMSNETVTVLPNLDVEKVTKLEIFGAPKSGDGPDQNSVVIEKVNGAWGVAAADAFPVDAQKVKDLLKTLAGLRSRTTVLENATYHEKLEVAPTKFQRKITLTSGDKTQTLYVGSSPSFKNVHVRVDGDDRVLMVNDLSTSDVGDRAWHWVTREYVDVTMDKVWAITITNAKGPIQLEKNPLDNKWAVLGLTEPLDDAAVTDLVRKASTMSLDTPIGKTVKPEFGLDQPIATVTLTTGTSTIAGTPPPTTENITIKVGKKLDKENQYYVKSSASAYVVRVPGFAIDPLVNKARTDLVKKAEK